MVSCALWEFEEALGWVILNNALAPLVHYSESPTLVPLQILHNAQLTILYCPNIPCSNVQYTMEMLVLGCFAKLVHFLVSHIISMFVLMFGYILYSMTDNLHNVR